MVRLPPNLWINSAVEFADCYLVVISSVNNDLLPSVLVATHRLRTAISALATAFLCVEDGFMEFNWAQVARPISHRPFCCTAQLTAAPKPHDWNTGRHVLARCRDFCGFAHEKLSTKRTARGTTQLVVYTVEAIMFCDESLIGVSRRLPAANWAYCAPFIRLR